MTTTHTSGAAIQRYKIGYHADEWGQRSSTPSGIPDASGSWVRYADHVTALAAGQATAAPAQPAPDSDDSLLLCASDLQHSAIYDNHVEMQACMRAVADRITALATNPADSVLEDAARYRFLRDGEWRDTDLEPFIRLQINTLWDAKIDAARKQGEKQ